MHRFLAVIHRFPLPNSNRRRDSCALGCLLTLFTKEEQWLKLSNTDTALRCATSSLKGGYMNLAVSKDTQLKRARLYPAVIHLHLDEANLCVNCDTIHTGDNCPSCASRNHIMLSSVIGRMPQTFPFKRKGAPSGSPAAALDATQTAVFSGNNNSPSFFSQLLHLITMTR